MIQIYHNNRCSKSRECVSHLQDMGAEIEIINYLKNPPSEVVIEQLLKKLKIQPIDLVRTNEKIWKDNYSNSVMTDAEIIAAMALHPVLIQRPIVVTGEKAVIARPLSAITQLL